MIKFTEKKYRTVSKLSKYYTERGFEVGVVKVNDIYNITVSEYKAPKKKLVEGK